MTKTPPTAFEMLSQGGAQGQQAPTVRGGTRSINLRDKYISRETARQFPILTLIHRVGRAGLG
jgi:hypothetical protein